MARIAFELIKASEPFYLAFDTLVVSIKEIFGLLISSSISTKFEGVRFPCTTAATTAWERRYLAIPGVITPTGTGSGTTTVTRTLKRSGVYVSKK